MVCKKKFLKKKNEFQSKTFTKFLTDIFSAV